MDVKPGDVVQSGSPSPQPNLEEVLFVMGGRSLDDSDDEDDDDEDRDPRLLPGNCGFYNPKTRNVPLPPHLPLPRPCVLSICVPIT